MKNRTSLFIVLGLTLLAVFGLLGTILSNPAAFFQKIAIFLLVVATVYFLYRRFSKASPEKREQQAFRKAAKKSKKRFIQKEAQNQAKKMGSITSLKKSSNSKQKSSTHLTVIDGKKAKKKNRASF